ncbi:RICIN domain-containing protein, partial [Streptomyces sp. S6]
QPASVAHGRLFAPSAGLCLDGEDGRIADGVRAVLADCSASVSQQWSYQADGLLRSAATPTLCLAADADGHGGAAVLAGCVVHSGEVFFDLTVRGELLLRRGGGLVVAPGVSREGMGVVVTRRDGAAGQRWVFDSSAEGTEGAEGSGGAAGSGAGGLTTPAPSGGVAPDGGRSRSGPQRKGPGGPQGSEGDSAAPGASTEPGTGTAPFAPGSHTRVAQVGAQAPAPVSGVVEQVAATVREPVQQVTRGVTVLVGGLTAGLPKG